MHAVCEDFDKYFSAWNQDVYRLCFAMVGKAGDARDLTFKTFLRLGAAKGPEMKEKDNSPGALSGILQSILF